MHTTEPSTTIVSEAMRHRISSALADIERSHGVRILCACESGSRAWDLHSADSDYDVRFVYVHPPEWYLSVRQRRDVIEVPILDELDLHGWDIRKALSLLVAGKCVLVEWLNSPIQYRNPGALRERILDILPPPHLRRILAAHYRGFGREHRKRYFRDPERISAKHYFYAIRPALALAWMQENEDPGNLPIGVAALIDQVRLAGRVRTRLEALRRIKAQGVEADTVPRDPEIDDLIGLCFDLPLPGIEASPEAAADAADAVLLDVVSGQSDADAWP